MVDELTISLGLSACRQSIVSLVSLAPGESGMVRSVSLASRVTRLVLSSMSVVLRMIGTKLAVGRDPGLGLMLLRLCVRMDPEDVDGWIALVNTLWAEDECEAALEYTRKMGEQGLSYDAVVNFA